MAERTTVRSRSTLLSTLLWLIVERDWRLGREREQYHLRLAEAVPEPDAPSADAPDPRAPDGLLQASPRPRSPNGWGALGGGQGPHRARERQGPLRAWLDQPPVLPSVPGRYSSSSRHDSSPVPSVHRRNASVASGEPFGRRDRDRLTDPPASRPGCASWSTRLLTFPSRARPAARRHSRTKPVVVGSRPQLSRGFARAA